MAKRNLKFGIDLTSKLAHLKCGMRNSLIGYLSEFRNILERNKVILFVTKENYADFKQYETENINLVITNNSNLNEKLSKINSLHSPFNKLFLRQSQVPNIITIHDLTPELFPHNFPIELRQALYNDCHYANHIISISEFTKSTIIETYGIDQKKITTIYNNRNILFKQLISNQDCKLISEKYKLPRTFLLYPAAYRDHKNHQVLFEIADRLPKNVSFVFTTGETHAPKRFEKLRHEVNERYGVDKFKVVGYVNENDFPAFYKLALAIVFPSLSEGFGYPVIDAMEIGCPVVCSNLSSLPEIAGDAALYFDPQDSDDLACKINDIIKRRDLRKRLIRLGKLNLERFNNRSNAVKLLEVYEAVALS